MVRTNSISGFQPVEVPKCCWHFVPRLETHRFGFQFSLGKAVNSDCDAAIRGRALRLASVYARRRHGGVSQPHRRTHRWNRLRSYGV